MYKRLEVNMLDINYEKNTISSKTIEDFDDVNTPNELMEFMNSNIEYGYLDINNEKHINNIKGIRHNYKIMSIEEILSNKLGVCIEQAKLIKYFFDKQGIENKLYCFRRYETEEISNEEVKMHCFVLFKRNNIWYHFEHSDADKRGIHPYKSLDDAFKDITKRDDPNDIRLLTEIPEIPDGLSFFEFNEYVNGFDSIYVDAPNVLNKNLRRIK